MSSVIITTRSVKTRRLKLATSLTTLLLTASFASCKYVSMLEKTVSSVKRGTTAPCWGTNVGSVCTLFCSSASMPGRWPAPRLAISSSSANCCMWVNVTESDE